MPSSASATAPAQPGRNVGRPAAACGDRARHVADPTPACDEPTGDLDRDRDEILSMLQELNRELGKTIVMVRTIRRRRTTPSALHLDKGHFIERNPPLTTRPCPEKLFWRNRASSTIFAILVASRSLGAAGFHSAFTAGEDSAAADGMITAN